MLCRSAAPEHKFMCGSNQRVLSFAAHIESLRETHQAQMSHLLGLVLIAYAKIAHAFLQSQCQDKGPIGDVDKSPEAASRKFLEGYQMLDFCQIMHASRTHSLNFSKKYFEAMIAPAYYDTHLQYPLMSIRSIFESFQPWQGTEHQSTFVHSELFSPSFFRGLIGCFGTNTLEVIVAGAVRGSALFGKFSKMNHSCRKNTVNCDCEAASVRVFASQAIQCGEEITTTYRFDESGCTTEALAYIVRKRALDQYLFRCGVSLKSFSRVLFTLASVANANCAHRIFSQTHLKDRTIWTIQVIAAIHLWKHRKSHTRLQMLPSAKSRNKSSAPKMTRKQL